MTADLQRKKDGKYDQGLAQEAMEWIGAVLEDDQLKGVAEADAIYENLKSGEILCQLINRIKPGSIKKINNSKMAFKMMENISNFLTSCENLGMLKTDLFQTVDLYEKQNMPLVINGIHALGRKAQAVGYDGPVLGPKEASENKREFTEEQLRAGEGIIGLQAGSNKGASQAGQNFGKTRAIID